MKAVATPNRTSTFPGCRCPTDVPVGSAAIVPVEVVESGASSARPRQVDSMLELAR